MGIGTRIVAARKLKGWTQTQLAEAVNVAQTTVSSWERDRTEPSRADVVRIASRLNIPLTEIEDVLRGPKPRMQSLEIPLLSWVSAGQISDVGELESVEGADTITVGDLPPGEYFATDVRGDSMDRISPERSRIIVNVADRIPKSGRAYLFQLRGETTYKFYQGKPVKRLEPFSTNPMNKTIFLGEDPDWTVIGRVFRSYIDLQ